MPSAHREPNLLAALIELEDEAARDVGTPRDANPHADPKYAAAWHAGGDQAEQRLHQEQMPAA